MWKTRKTSGGQLEVVISGFDKGIAPSPHDGIADLKNVNISSIKGEVSVAYARSRQDQASFSATFSVGSASTSFAYGGTAPNNGTWVKVTSHTGTPGTTDNNYYYLNKIGPGTYNLYSDFGITIITSSGSGGTITVSSLVMGVPLDYTVESLSNSNQQYRYFVLDQNGVVWVSGTSAAPSGNIPGVSVLSATTIWSAITPHGSTPGFLASSSTSYGSIAIMYATDSSNTIQASYMLVFTDTQILWWESSAYTDGTHGWPSNTGADATVWKTLNYFNFPHKNALGNDQVLYFTDGPGIGIVQQKTGQQFNPATSSTYNYVNANYLMAPTDAATRVAVINNGNGLSIVAGGLQNNLYIYPTYQQSTATGAAPNTLLWMPESNTQYLLQVNNYILIFAGSKGNIYLTNGSSVVPLMTVPDYVTGSATYPTSPNFVQDPYFIWGGAAYIRGRVFFSIKDQTGSHTGNCGGVWSFVPSFSYFSQQDSGNALRMESASSLWSTEGYNGYAPVIFGGQWTTDQQANGPQYVACWAQSVNSIDYSATTANTSGNPLIETDAIPIGTFLEKKTWTQFEVKFSAPLATGDSAAVYYRTSLKGAWASAGTVITESTNPISALVNGLNFQEVQLVQFQVLLTAASSGTSWCRVREMYLR